MMGAPPPYALNRELADGLRGARLVLELGLDEGRFATTAEVVGAARRRRPAAQGNPPKLSSAVRQLPRLHRRVPLHERELLARCAPRADGTGIRPRLRIPDRDAHPRARDVRSAGRGGAGPALGHPHPRPRRDPALVPCPVP